MLLGAMERVYANVEYSQWVEKYVGDQDSIASARAGIKQSQVKDK